MKGVNRGSQLTLEMKEAGECLPPGLWFLAWFGLIGIAYGVTSKSPNMERLCPGKVQTNW